MMSNFAKTPEPPYYAVIFTNQRVAGAGAKRGDGYSEMADRMAELATQQDGYLGAESTRDTNGFGITVSYWRDEASIASWKKNAEHTLARQAGNERWYEHFETRVARVERAYSKG
jgi:heme-degrading monooxygenase HmoA